MIRSRRWIGRVSGALAIVLLIALARGFVIGGAGTRARANSTANAQAARAVVLDALARIYPIMIIGLLIVLGLAVLGLILGRRGRGSGSGLARRVAARAALAGIATLLVMGVVEASAAVYLAWLHRSPRLAMSRAAARRSADDHVKIVVVGESSAEGVPYRDWFSLGKIVTWQLRRLFPQRMFHLEVQARAGWTLEKMHQKLAESRERPDAVILYAGHNEFAMRYGWSWEVPYYLDERRTWGPSRAGSAVAAWSPLRRFLHELRDQAMVAAPPPPRYCSLVDVPSFTAEQYRERLEDFRRRVEMILADLQAAGVLTVVIVPPGNDAGYEPDRSVLPAETARAERESFAQSFSEARGLEAVDPRESIKRYRGLIAHQPGFAESHFRLARLLQQTGEYQEAYQEYIKARDLDGHPMRCTSAFQDVYRELAPRYGAVLVDGQEVLHAQGRHGLLDDHLFNDGMHPSLAGHVALAQATLAAMKERGAFGWPASLPAPLIDIDECADHFDVTLSTWKEVCRFAVGFYRTTRGIRFGSSERDVKAGLYEAALRRLEAGEAPERLELPGIGVRSGSVEGDRASPAGPIPPALLDDARNGGFGSGGMEAGPQ